LAREAGYDTDTDRRCSQIELSEDELDWVSAAGGRVDPGGANN